MQTKLYKTVAFYFLAFINAHFLCVHVCTQLQNFYWVHLTFYPLLFSFIARTYIGDYTWFSQVCYKKTNGKCIYLKLIPDLLSIMSRSLDYEIRLFAWKGFRYITGPKVKPHFIDYVNISNIGAREHGWNDLGQCWRSDYELGPGGVVEMMKGLWMELKPLYQKFHGYIR